MSCMHAGLVVAGVVEVCLQADLHPRWSILRSSVHFDKVLKCHSSVHPLQACHWLELLSLEASWSQGICLAKCAKGRE